MISAITTEDISNAINHSYRSDLRGVRFDAGILDEQPVELCGKDAIPRCYSEYLSAALANDGLVFGADDCHEFLNAEVRSMLAWREREGI